ncbi:N-acetylneuraminate synthase [Leptospira biflexa]|uniref:N-acetylneuraminate synthase n=1 Tax=Leptospira biflexa TaxID=172 RepID=UPI0010842AC3|nr:N-acetylneuraminate synthase [Leptospira biflexa]TGM31709.1 N-acetylneuraminate synthase [Leptospira biflexa]TGM39132.1 N-acetylneuraminate synthase [Leptospira biflexa]TGM44544.1 N-acetylneuraminate synthase [Leptospira biflexa]TGM45415.1 N-acetylneuraminate synthase [Leptospira biflexa]TGM53969.1 N-acetylneuraminate synthase [Leptospira biflexa]
MSLHPRNKTLIIAEAGVNHNGDMKLAEELIDIAFEAGVDVVKFQTFTAENLVTESAKKATYQTLSTDPNETQYTMLKKLEISNEEHWKLIDHCKKKNIEFLSTAFDIESLEFLTKLNLNRYKIPSGEITNLPYLKMIGRLNKPVILSTGMSTLGEIEAAIAILEGSGLSRQDLTVLHCNTEYPTPVYDVNLNAMISIRDAFGVSVGYSDHTSGIEISLAAVAMGATVIEKHFTIDKTLPGPDHKASLNPIELISLVKGIRNIEQALGDGIKRPSKSEEKNKNIARKSIVAKCLIKFGDTFSSDNLTTKRPGNGISPMRMDEVFGRVAKRDFLKDEIIEI